jgi:cytoskeletal protein CcmA (bactofilin family)
MALLANVTLLNTFDDWRTRTNQIIYKLDQIETNTLNVISNTATINIRTSANIIFIDSNALSTSGGTISGNMNVSNNLNVTSNLRVAGNVWVSNNFTVSKNITSANVTVSQQLYVAGNIILNSVSGVINLL